MGQATMLSQIEQVLRRGKPTDGPAYTLILGAGASYGSVPTVKQMLGLPDKGENHPQCIPLFLRKLESGDDDFPLDQRGTIVKEFWQKMVAANPDLAKEIKDGLPLPDPLSIARVYRGIFDQKNSGGLNTPAAFVIN